jgi:serine/threonine-protein kinase HipA
MSRCPITYKECGTLRYSREGLRRLSYSLNDLRDFPYNAESQRREAVIRAAKMSIQGVQPKLSVKLNVKECMFEITDRRGQYIIKPQHELFNNLPENEAITMRMAGLAGIEVPVHGLIYCVDGSLSYFIKRFDRTGRGGKLATEDFAQLAGLDRETKYEYSIEKTIFLLDRYCTFPALEKVKLFKRILFSYLTGNEDMHLKNFSIITRDGKNELSPAYDLLNSTIAYIELGKSPDDIEESALTIKGRKKKLTASLLITYLAGERMGLNEKVIADCLQDFRQAMPQWESAVNSSLLTDRQKQLYLALLAGRTRMLGL